MKLQPDLPIDPRPTEFIARTSEEFQALCNRTDFLTKVNGQWQVTRRGEFVIETSQMLPANEGIWKIRVRYNDQSER